MEGYTSAATSGPSSRRDPDDRSRRALRPHPGSGPTRCRPRARRAALRGTARHRHHWFARALAAWELLKLGWTAPRRFRCLPRSRRSVTRSSTLAGRRSGAWALGTGGVAVGADDARPPTQRAATGPALGGRLCARCDRDRRRGRFGAGRCAGRHRLARPRGGRKRARRTARPRPRALLPSPGSPDPIRFGRSERGAPGASADERGRAAPGEGGGGGAPTATRSSNGCWNSCAATTRGRGRSRPGQWENSGRTRPRNGRSLSGNSPRPRPRRAGGAPPGAPGASGRRRPITPTRSRRRYGRIRIRTCGRRLPTRWDKWHA